MADTRKVKWGIDKCYYAPLTYNSSTNTYTYETPIRFPGMVNVSFDQEGSIESFYADNGPYWTGVANNGYTGTLEAAIIPESFKINVLNMVKEEASGALVEYSDRQPIPFAFMGEISGDSGQYRFVYYHCTVTRPSTTAATTEDTVTPQTESLDLTIIPRLNDKAVVKGTVTGNSDFDTFFDAVVEPVTE